MSQPQHQMFLAALLIRLLILCNPFPSKPCGTALESLGAGQILHPLGHPCGLTDVGPSSSREDEQWEQDLGAYTAALCINTQIPLFLVTYLP